MVNLGFHTNWENGGILSYIDPEMQNMTIGLVHNGLLSLTVVSRTYFV
jgi:hypothetical protein